MALAQSVGVSRGGTFPQETELVEKLKVLDPPGLLREAPVTDRILPHRDWIQSLLEHPHMTAKQVWRLFRERTDLAVSYWTMKRYLRTQFQFGTPSVTVRLEVESGSQAQVDLGYAGMMVDPSTGKLRKTWVFIMALSYSRHRFV